MTRPTKKGLDYYPLECLDSEELFKLKLHHGLNGWATIIKLYTHIYKLNGYYAKNTQDTYNQLMFECNIDTQNKQKKEKVKEIVQFAIDIGIFDKEKAEKEKILTSKLIQMNYILGAYKRHSFNMEKKYFLFKKSDVENFKVNLVFEEKTIYSDHSFRIKNNSNSSKNATKEKRREETRRDENRLKDNKYSLNALRKQELKEKNKKEKELKEIIDFDWTK